MLPTAGTPDPRVVPVPPVPRALSVAISLSNGLLVSVAGISLLFCVYSVMNQKSDLLIRLSPAMVGLAAPLLLLFRPAIRLIAAAAFVGVFVGVYTAQFFSLVLIDPDRPALQDTERIAKENGIRYDGRTRLQAIQDFRRHGSVAYPPFYPYHLFDPPLLVNGQPVIPLGSLSHALTVCCNEGGQYLTYTTDEHGFPNPADSWSGPVDVAFVGASAAVGESVPAADNLLWQLRARYPRVVTVGAGGNGPLLELASIREYLGVLKPKRVLWMFSESHTPEYLDGESRSRLLLRYLEDPSFTQNLLERQPELDRAIAKYFEDGMRVEAAAESWKTKVKDFILLKNIRTVLYYFVTARTAPLKQYPFHVDLYEQVLREGRRMIEGWGGSITIVYFPDSSRYAGICNYTPALRQVYDRTHDSVMGVARKVGLPVIDLSKAFADVPASEAARNAPYFYPYPAHYTPRGYHHVGKAILDALEAAPAGGEKR